MGRNVDHADVFVEGNPTSRKRGGGHGQAAGLPVGVGMGRGGSPGQEGTGGRREAHGPNAGGGRGAVRRVHQAPHRKRRGRGEGKEEGGREDGDGRALPVPDSPALSGSPGVLQAWARASSRQPASHRVYCAAPSPQGVLERG